MLSVLGTLCVVALSVWALGMRAALCWVTGSPFIPIPARWRNHR